MTFIDHRADYGYTITTPSGDTIRRVVGRDDCRRSLVTNCATSFNSSTVDSNAYIFDALSRPITRTTGTTGILPVASSFAYNDRSEVISAVIGTNLFEHAYDGIGNHMLFADNAITNTFTHNQVNQMVGRVVPNAPPTAFVYTPDGGLSSDCIWSYSYGIEDQLVTVTSASLTNDAIRVLNSYDYRRRRTSKTVQRLHVTSAPPPAPPSEEVWETVEKRTFVYDDWNLIYETIYSIEGGATNTTEVQYFWGLDLSDSLQGAGGVGGLLAVSRNGQFYFPTYDNNGNVSKYLDESGNIAAAYEYSDFGRIIFQSYPLANFFRHRFSTKYYDSETGLYYYGYRFYHSILMRWFTRDPLEEEGSLNLTSFVDNNAINVIDPLGDMVVVILAGRETPRRNGASAFKQTQNHMQLALQESKRIYGRLQNFSEKNYNCLRNKGKVFFDTKPFNGSLDEFRKKVARELSSLVRPEESYSQSLRTLARESVRATESYDYIVYAAHGESAFSGVGIAISYSDDLKDQKKVAKAVNKNMKNQSGTRLFVSCYSTWDGKGVKPQNRKETLVISKPRLMTEGELRYIPSKCIRTIGGK